MYDKLCFFFPRLTIDEVYNRVLLLTGDIIPQNICMFLRKKVILAIN